MKIDGRRRKLMDECMNEWVNNWNPFKNQGILVWSE